VTVYSPKIRVEIDDARLERLLSFSLSRDMLTPSDQVTLVYPATGRLLQSLQLDAPVRVYFDGIQVFTGRLPDIDHSGGQVTITVRDGIDRLVETSVPGVGFRLSNQLSVAIKSIVSPWFQTIVFDNATDRRLIAGRGKRARVSGEPVITASSIRALGRYADAGELRWSTLERVLETFRLLAWSSADGQSLIVTRPNYNQTTTHRLIRAEQSNVISMRRGRSIAGRYKTLELSGTQTTPGIPPPPIFKLPGQVVKKRVQGSSRGRVTDTSSDFLADKRLLVNDGSIYPRDAQATAERIFGTQQARADTVQANAPGFGQGRTLYDIDTMASVTLTEPSTQRGREQSAILKAAPYYLTAVEYTSNGDEQRSQIELLPAGTQLV
jgi:prophage tail gpP-like protein